MVGSTDNSQVGSDAQPSTSASPDTPEDFGVLLGWTADDLGDRLVLKMQSARQAPKSDDDIREFTYFVKREQAVLLGNFLYRITGETAPVRPRRSILAKLLGRP